MSKRIEQLAEQARDYARSHVNDCKHYGYHMEYNEFDLQFEKKFAELIVRECADICITEGESYKYSFTPSKARLAESTSKHCAIMLKKYFGIE